MRRSEIQARSNPSAIGSCLALLVLGSFSVVAIAAGNEGEAVVAAGDHRVYVADLSDARGVRRSEPIEGIGRPVVIARSGESRLLVGSMRDRFQETYRELVEIDLDTLMPIRPDESWRGLDGKPYSFGEIYELKAFPAARLALVACQKCGEEEVLLDLEARKVLKGLPDGSVLGSQGVEPTEALSGSMQMERSERGGIRWRLPDGDVQRQWQPRAGGVAQLEKVAIDRPGSRLLVPVVNGSQGGELVLLSFDGRVLGRFDVGPNPTNALFVTRHPATPEH
jgi:hypothetical protein